MVKNLPVMWKTWVRSLGWEDPLEEGMATHSGTLAWRIPMDRGAWWAAVHRVAKIRTRLKQLSMRVRIPIMPGGYLVRCVTVDWDISSGTALTNSLHWDM